MEKHIARNRLQNFAIVLLSISAVLLFARTQFVNFGNEGGSISRLLGSTVSGSGNDSTASLADFPMPVHFAVTGPNGCFGSTYTTTADSAFSGFSTLLGEALGSVKAASISSDAQFRAALTRGGIYADFRSVFPLSVLAELLGASPQQSELSARRLLLCATDERVQLYLWQDQDHCYSYPTPLLPATLEAALLHFQASPAAFAFEMHGDFDAIDPYFLFTDPLPDCNTLSAGKSPVNTDTILRELGFNPHTNFRYPEADGTEVIVENSRTLRVQPDGTVSYRSDDDSLKVAGSGETLTASALGAFTLATQLLQKRTGDAALYLQSVRSEGSLTRVSFGFLVDGIPVRFADEGAAADFELEGNVVKRFSIRYRQYALSGEPSLLLPLRQVLAIARSLPNTQLSIAYVDDGTESSRAAWLAD